MTHISVANKTISVPGSEVVVKALLLLRLEKITEFGMGEDTRDVG